MYIIGYNQYIEKFNHLSYLGTDATHAEHIEKLKTRQYAALVDNHFVPGLLGIGLIDGYDAIQSEQYCNFAKPYLRAALEIDLNEICEGRKLPNNVLEEQVGHSFFYIFSFSYIY